MASVEKRLQVKVKHHYVWAHYLKKWSLDGLNVHYTTQKNNNIVCDRITGVAMEKNFYQVKHFTKEQVRGFKMLSSLATEELQKQHNMYLNDFLLMQTLDLKYQRSGIKDDKAEQMIKAWKGNTIENLHSSHENDARPIIDALEKQDLTILDDEQNILNFLLFIGQQITRTKNFKNTVPQEPSESDIFDTLFKDCWWFVSYILGTNIGSSLYSMREQDTHCLLINNTGTPFITSDQPVINVHQNFTDGIKLVSDEHRDFYYPISPSVAYMINKSNRFKRGKVEVSIDVVEEMNIKMSKRANIHIFSNSDESLKKYKEYIGSNFQAVKGFVTESSNGIKSAG